jgi:flavin-dependent dehydrogenase
LTRFRRLHFRFRGVPFAPPTRQFAVRRVEFDHWLLQRSGADVVKHNVRHIESTSRGYLVDGTYSGRFIVGAGGTQCPVARSLFPPSPEAAARRIVTLEEELPYESGVEKCYLWFFDRGLPGYAWYIPKTGGFTTVGIGGLLAGMQRRGTTIREHWNRLTGYLNGHNMLPRRPLRPAGHSYYLRGARRQLQQGSAYLVGDAAGLATRDMGEGIGPAIHSGRLAAHAIINGRSYSAEGIGAYSLRDILLPPKPYSQLR